MNAGRTYIDYLADILDAIRKVTEFIHGVTFEEFTKNDKTVFAVVRGLEIIGGPQNEFRLPSATYILKYRGVRLQECAIS